ncbi:MAG: DUF433 domain-containing protein [Sphingobacteriales bacterium]|nr:DUF433 domain-containing protein [Sphingobacteriales bacterium]
MEYLTNRITIDEKLCNGKPTIRAKRITVQTILEFLSAGESIDEILSQYPRKKKIWVGGGLKKFKKGGKISLENRRYYGKFGLRAILLLFYSKSHSHSGKKALDSNLIELYFVV